MSSSTATASAGCSTTARPERPLAWQKADAQAIFGHLQADAAAGFPVPFYPFSLQQADAHSRVADLDVDIIEDSLS